MQFSSLISYSNNFVKIKIFFQELNYEVIEESISYQVADESLITKQGGHMQEKNHGERRRDLFLHVLIGLQQLLFLILIRQT